MQVSGFVVREHCPEPSHTDSTMTLHQFLESQDIPAISGVDTRAITRRLRTQGVMMGMIAVGETPEAALTRLREVPGYGEVDFVAKGTEQPLRMDPPPTPDTQKYRVLVSDYGLKYNIMRILRSKGCSVEAIPARASAEEV